MLKLIMSLQGGLTRLALLSVRGYRRFVSPYLPRACRFVPSCSVYAECAIRKYGVFRGGLLAAKRILRCNPLFDGGYDPVH